jgi:ADP-heptose:LPS heptosyltransferase
LDRFWDRSEKTLSLAASPPATTDVPTGNDTTGNVTDSILRRAKQLLVCLRYGIGDVVMELPLLDTLRKTVPSARITAIGAAPAVEVLEGAGLVDEIVAYGDWGVRHFWDDLAGHSEADLALWLRKAEFDLVLDASCAPEAISDAVRRTGMASVSTDERTLRSALAGGANGAEALTLAARSGWKLPVEAHLRPTITSSRSEVEFAQRFLVQSGARRPLIGFCSLASSKLKRWPESRFAEVADWAIENIAQGVVLFEGGQDDIPPSMRRLMTHGDSNVVVRGLHLRRVAALLAECTALITNDTGLMHMAAAVGTPVVAVFGPTSPRVYLPRGRAVALSGDMDCAHRTHTMSPPGCWGCEHCLIAADNCTSAVHVETVIMVLRELLPRNSETTLVT